MYIMRDARFAHNESGLILIINLTWLDKPESKKRQDNAPKSQDSVSSLTNPCPWPPVPERRTVGAVAVAWPTVRV